jgi:hypothetical protein
LIDIETSHEALQNSNSRESYYGYKFSKQRGDQSGLQFDMQFDIKLGSASNLCKLF